MLRALCRASLNGRNALFNKVRIPIQASLQLPSPTLRCVSTAIDKEFATILKEEINLEREQTTGRASSGLETSAPEGFKLINQEGTSYFLQKKFSDGGIVDVHFDISGSVDPHQGNDDEEPATQQENEPEDQPILARPDFHVRLVKPNCEHAVIFHCSFPEVDDVEVDEEEKMPTFVVNSVQMAPAKANLKEVADKGYFVFSDLFDDNVFEHLMRLLLARGIDAKFQSELLDFTTSQEHRHYLKFLGDLKSYCESR